jgi:ATP-binding cassette subfamily C (CFTR/MRP) protein 1
VCSTASSAIAKVIGDRQKDWASATQQRLTKTKNVLNEMKGIKIMGLEDKMHHLLQNERILETAQMRRRNWIMVWINVVGMRYVPYIFCIVSTDNN